MIGKLKGLIDSYGEDFVIIDVNGVGYVVHCSATDAAEIASRGRGGCARDRDAGARGFDQAVRLRQ